MADINDKEIGVEELVGVLISTRPNSIENLKTSQSYVQKMLKTKNDAIFAEAIYSLTHMAFTPEESKRIWADTIQHKNKLSKALGRDAGIRVALMDFLSNIEKRILAPKVISNETFENLADSANKDELTGLHNFRYYKQRLHQEFSRAVRYGSALSLILFDLDDFKVFNDLYGHDAGNEALKKVGKVLKQNVRIADFAVRYGGEEFVIVLVETNKKGASVVAERVRRDVEELHLKKNLTISGGIASFPVDTDEEEEMFRLADRALYRAKSEGKNRVYLFHEERRRFLRLDCSVKVLIKRITPTGAALKKLMTTSLSSGGIAFKSQKSIGITSLVRGAIILPNVKKHISFSGKTVRVEEIKKNGFEVGIEFLQIKRRNQQLIEEYVRKRRG